jgi:hypothetical protein
MLSMKTSSLVLAASVAALFAVVLISAGLEAATSLFAAVGVLAITFRDYARPTRTSFAMSAQATAGTPATRSEQLGLAA